MLREECLIVTRLIVSERYAVETVDSPFSALGRYKWNEAPRPK
jgi:hypothetical protein